MPLTGSHATAYGAGLAGICRVRKLNPDAGSFRLVGDKRLQLRPGPSMEPGAHSFAGLDPFADVGQVLHGDGAAFVSNCFRDNSLADFVIHMSDMPGFATGDFLQQLPCRLRAVALKPGTKGKVFVAVMPELAAPNIFPVLMAAMVFSPRSTPATGPVVLFGGSGKSRTRLK